MQRKNENEIENVECMRQCVTYLYFTDAVRAHAVPPVRGASSRRRGRVHADGAAAARAEGSHRGRRAARSGECAPAILLLLTIPHNNRVQRSSQNGPKVQILEDTGVNCTDGPIPFGVEFL